MTQVSFSDAEYGGKRKQTRREIFRAEKERVVPWDALLTLVEPVYPKAGEGLRPYPIKTMLRLHLLRNWFGYRDPAMEVARYEVAPPRRFAGVSLSRGSVPDESTILNFRNLLERHDLAPKVLAAVVTYLIDKGLLLRQGTIVEHAPSSTENARKARDPEMHQTRKGPQRYFGMKAHIGVDVVPGLVHTVTTTETFGRPFDRGLFSSSVARRNDRRLVMEHFTDEARAGRRRRNFQRELCSGLSFPVRRHAPNLSPKARLQRAKRRAYAAAHGRVQREGCGQPAAGAGAGAGQGQGQGQRQR